MMAPVSPDTNRNAARKRPAQRCARTRALRPIERLFVPWVSVVPVTPDTPGAVIRLMSSHYTVKRQRGLGCSFPRRVIFHCCFVLRLPTVESKAPALHAYEAIRQMKVTVIV